MSYHRVFLFVFVSPKCLFEFQLVSDLCSFFYSMPPTKLISFQVDISQTCVQSFFYSISLATFAGNFLANSIRWIRNRNQLQNGRNEQSQNLWDYCKSNDTEELMKLRSRGAQIFKISQVMIFNFFLVNTLNVHLEHVLLVFAQMTTTKDMKYGSRLVKLFGAAGLILQQTSLVSRNRSALRSRVKRSRVRWKSSIWLSPYRLCTLGLLCNRILW